MYPVDAAVGGEAKAGVLIAAGNACPEGCSVQIVGSPLQRRVTAYLKKRGIAPAIIRGFVEAGLL